MDFGGGDQIRFEIVGAAGIVTLTRPDQLNALTHDMVKALSFALSAWEKDKSVAAVIIQGEGRAFSSGGDVVDVYEAKKAGASLIDFFADEYRLAARIARFPKPYVALIDGIVMGGGVGIAFHGSHRVLTEKAEFAMPEVGIGFFPDVGASHLLPDLGGSFGLYLGLTGARIGYGDALWSGLATHTMKSEYLGGLVERLCESGEPDACMREFFIQARRDTDRPTLEKIARHFSRSSLQKIFLSLEQAAPNDEFAAKTLKLMRTRSPTSLAVTFRELTLGQTLSMDDCVRMEYRIVRRMLEGHDFYEGIRATIIDKDMAPKWQPATLDAVAEGDIDAYFAADAATDLVL